MSTAVCANPARGRSFAPKRSTGRYCSPACRKAAFLAHHDRRECAGTLSDDGLPVLSVPDAPAPPPPDVHAAENVFPLGRLPATHP
jgi:hypothetical protein